MPDVPSHQPLLAVPNVSEGRVPASIDAIKHAFTVNRDGVRLLDVHTDADHHRSVFTLAGHQGGLSVALGAGARAAIQRIDVGEGRAPVDIGEHPHVGAVDVIPLVYLSEDARGAACAEALVVADEIGEGLGVPVFLYGELARGRTRAELRRGGVSGLGRRLAAGELQPDFGPPRLHPSAGATLVSAREPLVAFNLELAAPASVDDARRIASLIREGGREGLAGVRAIGVSLHTSALTSALSTGAEPVQAPNVELTGEQVRLSDSNGSAVAQVSMNVERPLQLPLRVVVEAVRRHAEVTCGELVGLAPRAALEGFPADVPLVGFDAGAHVIENALGF